MKAEVKIPKGWRQVRRGKVRKGDRVLIWDDNVAGHVFALEWDSAMDEEVDTRIGAGRMVIRKEDS